tara:strand:- start:3895 stop:5127 length:1233 start_codon:yes stop_codon:yes gene_type:complete
MTGHFTLLIGRRYGVSHDDQQMTAFISRISTLGLVLGVALLILVLSVMNGFDRELRERILGIMPQAVIYHRQGMEDWRLRVAALNTKAGVIASAPFVKVQALAYHKAKVAPLILFGVDAELEANVSNITTMLPDFRKQLQGNANALLIGSGLAATLGLNAGSKLSIIVPNGEDRSLPKIRALTVSAIVHTGTQADHSLALSNLATAAHLTGQANHISGLRLKVDDLFAAPEIARAISREWGYGFYSSDWTRTHGNLYQAIQMSKQMVSMLLFLIIGIAAFNVVTTLIMVVSDKRSDIAILRTLGASKLQIMAIFLIQGSLIGGVGTLLGLILGVTMTFFASDFVAWVESVAGIQFLKSDVYPISYLPTDIQFNDVALVVIAALLLSALAAIYPAWKASRTQPAEALRYEV